MLCLHQRGHKVELQVLENEARQEYCRVIYEKCKYEYQLVPPNVHQINTYKRAINTFKSHFLALMDGIYPAFTNYFW